MKKSEITIHKAELIPTNEHSTRNESTGTTKFPGLHYLPLTLQNWIINSPLNFSDSFISEYIKEYINANSYRHVVGMDKKRPVYEKRFHKMEFSDNGIKWYENDIEIEKFNYHKFPMIGIDGDFVRWSGKYYGTKHEGTKTQQKCYHIGIVQNGEISNVLENINTTTYSLVSMPELEKRYMEMIEQSNGLLGIPRFVFFDNRRVFAVEFPYLGNVPMLENDPKQFYLVLWNSIDQRYAESVGFLSRQLRCKNQFTRKFKFSNNKDVRSMAKHTANYYGNVVEIAGILEHFFTYLNEKERIYQLFDKVTLSWDEVLAFAFHISGIDLQKAKKDLMKRNNLNIEPNLTYTLENLGLVNRRGVVLLNKILSGIEAEFNRDFKYTLGTIFRGITYYTSNVEKMTLFQSFHSNAGQRINTTFDYCCKVLIHKGFLDEEDFINYNKF